MYNPDENAKRKALDDVTNKVTTFSQDEIDKKRWAKFDESHWFPIILFPIYLLGLLCKMCILL
jgi:hypothetical protein